MLTLSSSSFLLLSSAWTALAASTPSTKQLGDIAILSADNLRSKSPTKMLLRWVELTRSYSERCRKDKRCLAPSVISVGVQRSKGLYGTERESMVSIQAGLQCRPQQLDRVRSLRRPLPCEPVVLGGPGSVPIQTRQASSPKVTMHRYRCPRQLPFDSLRGASSCPLHSDSSYFEPHVPKHFSFVPNSPASGPTDSRGLQRLLLLPFLGCEVRRGAGTLHLLDTTHQHHRNQLGSHASTGMFAGSKQR